MVADEIKEWQNRTLDDFYDIIYIDAMVVKVRDGGEVDNKDDYLVNGVDEDGFKHVLGIWLGTARDRGSGEECCGIAQPGNQGRAVRVLRRL